ncbi:hypothetical protein PF005_g7208 [Phytophthora fragariae]|uniref:Uncharacterized protein n=1 Tax=Phytophthora fragariae TaxID=53985 RepID=A0A6A4E941_9STRA|nr:hypothetical protein PF003_g12262 [Phytophthora fragariae]KAE9019264.1 hypothetical protein PF011_g5901 [Phytophthora fragariae]KAE9064742.1 hypothetical protein PF006_g30619 [Phytophthora fragariae]KAE9122848.1 hypothetical protein PF007_g7274 [Phytophthora fragariae]KAE9124406.1 hypothetical protein PF010_g6020 [Phytophthora fragariae]
MPVPVSCLERSVQLVAVCLTQCAGIDCDSIRLHRFRDRLGVPSRQPFGEPVGYVSGSHASDSPPSVAILVSQ